MFYDLNVRRREHDAGNENLVQVIKKLIEFGYRNIAITTEFTDSAFSKIPANEQKKGKKNVDKGNNQEIPSPMDLTKLNSFNATFYNRLNVLVSDPNSFNKINHSRVTKGYDIISYQPANAAILKRLASMNDFDIISFNPMIDSAMMYFSRKLYKQFVQNGVFMELPYTPAILDTSARKYLFFVANMYHSVGDSTNIVVTSGCFNANHIRTPYDVINLCSLYCLPEEKAKSVITENCKTLLLNARTRRRGRSVIEMEPFKSGKSVTIAESMELDTNS